MPKLSNEGKEAIIADIAEQVIERMFLDGGQMPGVFVAFKDLPDEFELEGKKLNKESFKCHIIEKLNNQPECQDELQKFFCELEQTISDQPLRRQKAMDHKFLERLKNIPSHREPVWMQKKWQQKVLDEIEKSDRLSHRG